LDEDGSGLRAKFTVVVVPLVILVILVWVW
jgi:hypothetical protein